MDLTAEDAPKNFAAAAKVANLSVTDASGTQTLEVRRDKDKTFTHKVYERVVGGVAKLLKNRPRKEVVTKADISGRLDNPNVKPSEVLIRLVQNAFFKAILPGLERETKRERA